MFNHGIVTCLFKTDNSSQQLELKSKLKDRIIYLQADDLFCLWESIKDISDYLKDFHDLQKCETGTTMSEGFSANLVIICNCDYTSTMWD